MSRVKIGFILTSNSRDPVPSTRIAVLNMFPFLVDAGFDPRIVFEPERSTETPDLARITDGIRDSGCRIIVFQKVHGESVETLARTLSAEGIRTVYMVCDVVDVPMVDATDATVTVTKFMRQLYPVDLQHKIHVVHDGIERPDVCKTSHETIRGSRNRPLHAVLVTSFALDSLPVLRTTPSWLVVSIVGRYPAAARVLQRIREASWGFAKMRGGRRRLAYLRFLADPRIRRIEWTPSRVYDVLQQADIGIIPIDTSNGESGGNGPPLWMVKSESRLTLKMSAGLPVVATPIPSYEPVIEHGRNGLFARSSDEWRACLEALRDPDLRRRLGEQARASVAEKYSKKEQARLLAEVFDKVLSGSVE